MITKIQATDFKKNTKNNYNYSCTKPKPNSFNATSYNFAQYNSNILQNYFINFTGKSNRENDLMPYSNEAEIMHDRLCNLAKQYKNKEVDHLHVILLSLLDVREAAKKYGEGKLDLKNRSDESAESFFINTYGSSIFENDTYRKRFLKAMDNSIKFVEDLVEKLPKDNSKSLKPKFSKVLNKDIEMVKASLGLSDDNEDIIDTIDIYDGAYLSQREISRNLNEFLHLIIRDSFQLEDKSADKRLYFKNYDKQADNVLKNLDMGTNMFITYDESKIDPNFVVPSIIKTFQNGNYGLNPKNTEIVEFNKDVEMSYLTDKVKELSKNKDKNYILIFSERNIIKNAVPTTTSSGSLVVTFSDEYLKLFSKTPKNIRVVGFETKEKYLQYMQNAAIADIFQNSGEISVPVLEKKDVYNSLVKNKEFLKDNNFNFSPKALESIVNYSAQMDGMFPNKTINLMRKIQKYYVDRKEITPKDIENYVKNSDYLFRQTDKDNSIEIVFNTGKRLKDIIGKNNTKKEAEYIVRQIKSNKIGTKGFIIYSQDGSPGAGRRHTAEVIAGEAKVPFVSINTMDFGTEEVDLFGGSAMSPEASIKKLFSAVTTQAQENPHKSAVLFVENFEYFSVGELVSEYHQKAMAQLIREMNNAEKKGLNIVVIGSVSNPGLIGTETAKSTKFNDEIEVSTPGINYLERYEILDYLVKQKKLKIAGSEEEQRKTLLKFAKFLDGASLLELKNFVQKSESIASERNHKAISSADMTEGFMRMETGRVNMEPMEYYKKEIIAKHECGHATAITVMNSLMKSLNRPWTVPNWVNFITLDPRGYYGGAVYSSNDINDEYSFEKMFSEIVLAYGGHSAEKRFYDMDGSLGITADIENVTNKALIMVKKFGQGYNTGKININRLGNVTDKINANIEKDVNVITRNALLASDLIIDAYSDFIDRFADKYADKVGTGECLIDGDDFRQEFEEWKSQQTPEKQAELALLDNILLDIVSKTKKSNLY